MTNPQTRAQAAAAGLAKFHGKPCRKCGHDLRWTITGSCIHCQAQWLKADRDRIRKIIKNKSV